MSARLPGPGAAVIGTVEDGGRLSVRRNFLALLAGRFFAALSMWLALIVLAKLSDPATVGMYALAQAVCLPLAEIARMGLREVYASDTAGNYEFGDYLGLRCLAILVALVSMVAAAVVVAESRLVVIIIAIYALSRGLELFSDMLYGLFQKQERMDYIARSLCLLGPLSLALLALGYWLTGSLWVAIAGQAAAHLAVLLYYDLPTGRRRALLQQPPRLWPGWHITIVARLARLAMPLTFATVLVMLALYLPRLMVEQALGLEALGYFAAIMVLAMAPARLVHTLGMASSVRLANYHASGDRGGFLRLLGKMVTGAAAAGATGVVLAAQFGDALLRVVYTEEYAAYADVLLGVVVAATLRFTAEATQFGIIAARRFWWLTFQHSCVALTAVVSCLSLIPADGLQGAALALIIICAVQLATVSLGMLCNLPARVQVNVAT